MFRESQGDSPKEVTDLLSFVRLDVRNDENQTALHLAVIGGHVE